MQASNVNISIRKAWDLRSGRLILCGLLLAATFGCGPASSTVDGTQGASQGLPEITEELIRERINDAGVSQVPEENGNAQPIDWSFDENEPKEIAVVEKQIDGTRATIVLDVKTSSAPRARAPRQLAGQIRTEWELETGWALRRWQIVRTENISMKYRNLALPPSPTPTQAETTNEMRKP